MLCAHLSLADVDHVVELDGAPQILMVSAGAALFRVVLDPRFGENKKVVTIDSTMRGEEGKEEGGDGGAWWC